MVHSLNPDLASHGNRRHVKALRAVLLLALLALTAAILAVGYERRSMDRARQHLAERIRDAYTIPDSASSSPIHALSEVVREGMLPAQVDSLLERIRSEVVRTEWFVVLSPRGPVGVAQGVILGTLEEELEHVYVYYFDGKVAFVRDEHRGNVVQISPDSARGLLDHDAARAVRRATNLERVRRGAPRS